jgi:hypothetical protein
VITAEKYLTALFIIDAIEDWLNKDKTVEKTAKASLTMEGAFEITNNILSSNSVSDSSSLG